MTLKTEEEARKCWCPMARVDTGEGVANRWDSGHDNLPSDTLCVASKCMFWRWAYSDPATDVHTGETYPPEQLLTGYCGLAGKP